MALTLVYAYYDNATMLEKHLQEWANYPPEIQIVLIDDASPNTPALDVLDKTKAIINFQLYRIKENIPWNQNGARNLGMIEGCKTEWALMLDMDHLLSAGHAQRALRMKKEHAHYYVPRRVWPDGKLYRRHPNSFLLQKEKFLSCGGYDEDFCGFYGSDSIFRMALDTVARRVETNAFETVHYEGIIKDANTKEFGTDSKIRKGSKFHSVGNKYLLAKRRMAPYKAANPLRFNWERIL